MAFLVPFINKINNLVQQYIDYDTLYHRSAKGLFYVYVHLDPRKYGRYDSINSTMLYEPFYVGKGKGNRYRHALSLNNRKHPHHYKINKIRFESKKNPYTVIVATFLTEEEAFSHEALLISHYTAQQIPLTNLEPGGRGHSTGRLPNPARSKITKGPSPLKNIPRSDSIKQKISNSKKQWHPTAKRWLVISPEDIKYTPTSLYQLIVDQLGYPNNGYKTLINVHLAQRSSVKFGIMKGWQIFEII